MKLKYSFCSFLFLSLQVLIDAPKSQHSGNGDSLEYHRNLTPTQLPWLNEVTTKLFDSSRMTIDAGTVTPKPTTIQLDDVFLAVKTTQMNHAKRLNIIAKTWFPMAREQVILVRFLSPVRFYTFYFTSVSVSMSMTMLVVQKIDLIFSVVVIHLPTI